jgi:hypothetical protein
MSREKEDFDLVYGEAFLSGTGHSPAEYDDKWSAFKEKFIADYVDRRAAFSDYTHPELTVFQHPYQEAWLTCDIEEIARICFFGRALIDTAKVNIANNPSIGDLTPENIDDVVTDAFSSKDWFAAHPGVSFDPEQSKDQDVASPLRLRDWPNGEYLNCLGVSIALAAAAELAGSEYLYGNELFTAEQLIVEQHNTVVQAVERILPGFFAEDGWYHEVLKIAEEILDEDVKYRSLFFSNDKRGLLRVTEAVRDHHHFVWAEKPLAEENQSMHVQVDPYALTYGIAYVDIDETLKRIKDGDPTAVVVTDISQEILGIYRQLHVAVRDIGQHMKQKRKIKESDGERTTLNDLLAGSEQIYRDFLNSAFESSADREKKLFALIHRVKKDALHDAFVVFRTAMYDYEKAVKLKEWFSNLSSLTENELGEYESTLDTIEGLIEQNEKYDTEQRDKLLEIGYAIPMVMLMSFYVDVFKYVFRFRDWGIANAAAEITNPEFMIGAMYLNHYATLRKDGRVNVARYLTRFSASQLIWQAAQLDGESVEDPSMQAVGEVVKSLKPTQQHPRVRFTVHGPQLAIQEVVNAQEKDAEEGSGRAGRTRQ